MSKLQEYLESTEQLRNRPRKFGFRINVKDEKTGEITSSFITGDTIEEFITSPVKPRPSGCGYKGLKNVTF